MKTLIAILIAAIGAWSIYPARSTITGDLLVNCGGVNDTSAIQSAVDANKAGLGRVRVAPGHCIITNLNFDNTHGLIFSGAGRGVTYFIPIPGAMNMFNGVNAYKLTLENFTCGLDSAQTLTPQSCIYLAQGTPAENNINEIRNVHVTGAWSQAAVIFRGACCANIINSQLWSYNEGAALKMDGSGGTALPSAFLTASTAPSTVTMVGLFGVEAHNLTGAAAVTYNYVNSINWFGGGLFSPNCLTTKANYSNINYYGTLESTDVGGTPHHC